MSTTGYLSLSLTKEAGTPPLPIPANEWTPIDFGAGTLMDHAIGQTDYNAQLYFEGIPASATKAVVIAVRVRRGNGNPTAQDDRSVTRTTWAISYVSSEFIPETDVRRGIEVWASAPVTLQSRIYKATNDVAYGAARSTPDPND